jgi:hypothetical protein
LSSCASEPTYIPSGGGGYSNDQGFYDDNNADYPYYEDNDAYYQDSNKYPTYDPNADNSNYYYENYDKKLPSNDGSNIDNTYPIYFD